MVFPSSLESCSTDPKQSSKVCVSGPDRGQGLVVLSNGDNEAALMNAGVSRTLRVFFLEGTEWSSWVHLIRWACARATPGDATITSCEVESNLISCGHAFKFMMA